MGRIAFSIGPFHIYWYGIILIAGALIGAYVSSLEAKRRGLDPGHVWDALFYCLFLGVVGARIYHVISMWYVYRHNLLSIFRLSSGGLAMYGGVAGGALALYLYTRLNKLDFLLWADIGAIALILAQAIGRWGNFINQELFGFPTNLPWGMPIDREMVLRQLPELANYERFHPIFLYESLWNLLALAIMLLVARRLRKRLLNGDILFLYLILYPLGRFLVESLRPGPPGPSWWPLNHPLSRLFVDSQPDPNSWNVGGFRVAQVISLVCIALSLLLMIWRHSRAGKAGASASHG